MHAGCRVDLITASEQNANYTLAFSSCGWEEMWHLPWHSPLRFIGISQLKPPLYFSSFEQNMLLGKSQECAEKQKHVVSVDKVIYWKEKKNNAGGFKQMEAHWSCHIFMW